MKEFFIMQIATPRVFCRSTFFVSFCLTVSGRSCCNPSLQMGWATPASLERGILDAHGVSLTTGWKQKLDLPLSPDFEKALPPARSCAAN